MEIDTSSFIPCRDPRRARDPAGVVPGRLPVVMVERLHRVIGGEARAEAMVLQFIHARYGAKNLLHLPAQVAREVLRRPNDFVRAAKQYCEPELRF